jgi:hypothetical protein
MTQRIWYPRQLAGAIAVAGLMVSAPIAAAQSPSGQRTLGGIDEAIQALDQSPQVRSMSRQARKELVEFAVGNTLFVLAHELGHLVIEEMGLPVLGREEDAAESFAILAMLHMHVTFSERVLIEAAKGWLLSSYRDRKERNALAFHDEHSLDLQRAYQVVCLMVGFDPVRFKALAAETRLPEERQASCVRDHRNAAWSWDTMLKPYRRSADQPTIAIAVEHKDDGKYAVPARILRHMRVLETVAEHAADRIAWKAPFTIEARACGEANARYFLATRTVTLCYELVQEFTELFLGYSRKLPNFPAEGAKRP